MNILVTGADGFLGAAAVDALLAGGHVVGALVRPDKPLHRLGAAAYRAHEAGGRLQVLRGDVQEPENMAPLLIAFRPDACLHLAWYVEPGKYLQSPHNIAFLHRSLLLVQMLADVGCGQFVGVGTCAEYDASRGWLREDGPTRPESLYAAAKLSLHLCGEPLAHANGMAWTWARIFYPYGPREDGRRMVPSLIRALLNGQSFPASQGDQIRDYIHVEDIARAFAVLIQQRTQGVVNVGSGNPVSVRHLMQTVETLVQRPGLIQFGALPPREWEPRFLCADTQKLRALGWQPHYELRDGLAAAIEWWQAQASEEQA